MVSLTHLMNHGEWKNFWEELSKQNVSDFELDRGTCLGKEIENLPNQELLDFVEPKPDDVIFDAGCGTGVNILLLHSKVKQIIGMDYSKGTLARCKRRIVSNQIDNVELLHGDITRIPATESSVDKVLCLSVLQYLKDDEVRGSFKEFVRILKDQGVLILHVKNFCSLYLATLWAAKRIKMFLGMKTKLEHFRSYRWYVGELQASGFEVLAYNSLNLFMIQSMPRRLVLFFQKLELKYRNKFPFRLGFMRRRGSELKIKARVRKTHFPNRVADSSIFRSGIARYR
jgi:ubiquinone/menaquinone biosynthesis C-methylase UbiE